MFVWKRHCVSGLFFGARFQCVAVVRHVSILFPRVLLALVIGFLGWRWGSIYLGVDLTNQTWLLDKWHLGPLRLINFFAIGWLISKLLKRFECWPAPFRPLALIGRHMLPVFCCQICLS